MSLLRGQSNAAGGGDIPVLIDAATGAILFKPVSNSEVQLKPAFTPTANSGAGIITNANTDYTVLAANSSRKLISFTNTHASATIYINPLGSTSYNSGFIGIPVMPLSTYIFDIAVPNTAIHASSDTANVTFFIMEG
jgi:hypothetical protein